MNVCFWDVVPILIDEIICSDTLLNFAVGTLGGVGGKMEFICKTFTYIFYYIKESGLVGSTLVWRI